MLEVFAVFYRLLKRLNFSYNDFCKNTVKKGIFTDVG